MKHNNKKQNSNKTLIDGYNILENKGEGWNSKVFKVEDKKNTYFMKLLKDERYDNNLFTDHYKQYYSKFGKIHHDNILTLVPLKKNKNNKLLYILTKYIEGKNLSEFLKISVDQDIISNASYICNVLNIMKQICTALNFLHNKKIFHENLKLTNIYIADQYNKPFLLDFGWAELIESSDVKIQTTEYYRPQNSNKYSGIELDIYSTSLIYFELLTGKHYTKVNGQSVHKLNPSLTQKIDDILSKAMLKKKSKYKSINEFSTEISDAISAIFSSKKVKSQPKEKVIYPTNDDEDYSFTITEAGSPQNYYFKLDEDGLPIKLGDGTFGVVFLVNNNNGEEFAVKILYNRKNPMNNGKWCLTHHIIEDFIAKYDDIKKDVLYKNTDIESLIKEPSSLEIFLEKVTNLDFNYEQKLYLIKHTLINPISIAQERFKSEMDVTRILTARNLTNSTAGVSGLIKTRGGTSKFLGSNADNTFKQKCVYDTFAVDLSSYALVIDAYEWTLKEILETGPGKFDEEVNGYKVLESMQFRERISTIMPFLLDISSGLKTLHEAGLYHHDLKPSNIFVKEIGGNVHSVIGDLSFISTHQLITDSFSNIKDMLPRGTRHYRSPEQKDFFDVCEVSIPNFNKEENIIEIVTPDPKFRDSIIEKDDFLVFCKDSEQIPYKIKEIKLEKKVTKIYIEKGNNPLPKTDSRTQIFMYKQQKERTDLFGFGAIVFDMITCGESPERFYDNIRSYDNVNTNDTFFQERISDVTTILDMYRQVAAEQLTDPVLLHIFAPFRHKKTQEYAPFEIVKLILKCMFYKAKNTFYHSVNNNDADNVNFAEASNQIHDLLCTLVESQNSNYISKRNNNNLLTGEKVEKLNEEEDNELAKKIKKLQPLIPSLRLARGIWYLRQISELINKNINSKDNTAFFYEMLPESINIVKNSCEYPTYETEDDYKVDLITNHLFIKISQNILNKYTPNYVSFMRRKIKLTMKSEEIKNRFTYIFEDQSFFGNEIDNNDWIVNDKDLWKVETDEKSSEIALVHEGTLQFNKETNKHIFQKTSKNDSKSKIFELDQEEPVYYFYKNLDPCNHYLQILGVYVYNIFISGFGSLSVNDSLLPIITDLLIKIQNRKVNSKLVEIKDTSFNNFENITLKSVYQYITYLFIKLSFPDVENSFYKSSNSDKNRIANAHEEIDNLKIYIAKALSINKTKLERYIDSIDAHIEDSDKPISFDDLFSELLELNLPNCKKHKKINDLGENNRNLRNIVENNNNKIKQLEDKIEKLEGKTEKLNDQNTDIEPPNNESDHKRKNWNLWKKMKKNKKK